MSYTNTIKIANTSGTDSVLAKMEISEKFPIEKMRP